MALTREDHLAFWRTLSAQVSEGTALCPGLRRAGSGGPFAPIAQNLNDRIEDGSALSDALRGHPDAFSQCVIALVNAGEMGGVLDVICTRIVEGLEDGSLPLPGVEPESDEMVRYWRVLGRMLGSGVPMLDILRLLREEVAEGELAAATGRIQATILEGRSLAEAMAECGHVFPEPVQFTVRLGEANGNVDEAAMQVAGAVEAGDLSALPLPDMDRLPPVRRFVNTFIMVAIGQKASDVHIDPVEHGKSRVRLRIDGVLHDLEWPDDVEVPPTPPHAEMVNRIKVMAGMDIAERRMPQDGRIELSIGEPPGEGRPVDLRVSTVPTVHGERVVMRVLPREMTSLTLDGMAILEDDLERIRQIASTFHGTVLCAGPTGSGKTTLLYALLREYDGERSCLMAIEDPVEYYLDGVAQMQVQPQIGRTFARLLRSAFRQDPDYILVGEIRDLEVANLVAQCSLTGHVVLTTLHAATAPGGLKRLVDMGMEPFVVNASIAGVISQRLVRMVCKECREPVDPPAHSLPPETVELLAGREGATFYAARGCDACNGWGYRGRTCIHEILIPDDAVKRALADGADLPTLRDAAKAAGMRTMLECGIEKAARGITTVQEVLRVVPHGPNE